MRSRQQLLWDHTAELKATLINLKIRKWRFRGEQLNPYRERPKPEPVTLDDMDAFL